MEDTRLQASSTAKSPIYFFYYPSSSTSLRGVPLPGQFGAQNYTQIFPLTASEPYHYFLSGVAKVYCIFEGTRQVLFHLYSHSSCSSPPWSSEDAFPCFLTENKSNEYFRELTKNKVFIWQNVEKEGLFASMDK